MTRHRHAKVSVTLPAPLLVQLDALVSEGAYPSRSAALERAARLLVRERLNAGIERALAATDHDEEAALAEEDMAGWSDLVRSDPAGSPYVQLTPP